MQPQNLRNNTNRNVRMLVRRIEFLRLELKIKTKFLIESLIEHWRIENLISKNLSITLFAIVSEMG